MADEFGQIIRGIHAEGDSVVATDTHIGVLGEDGSNNYRLLEIGDSGGLKVDIVDATGIQVDVDIDQVSDGLAVATGSLATAMAGTDGTNFRYIATDASGVIQIGDNSSSLTVDAINLDIRDLSSAQDSVTVTGSVWTTGSDIDIRALGSATDSITIADGGNTITVDANQLDIDDLSHTVDSVKIGDGTDFLAVNADGSINVSTSGTTDSAYSAGNATLVKDTITTVVTRSPGSDESFKAIIVSGAGLCQWILQFGTTASEATIIEFWTTPSSPTQVVDLPDSLIVSSGETILVRATNRESAASTASDFTGYASLVRGA